MKAEWNNHAGRCVAMLASVLLLLNGCTFSATPSGDYVQQVKPVKVGQAEKAGFYVTCTSFARNYDQVNKVRDCNFLLLESIVDLSVQEEVLAHFAGFDFEGQLQVINTQRPESTGLSKLVHLDIHEEYGWPRLGFQALVSTLSMTVIPLDYPREYTLSLSIENLDGSVVKSTNRRVTLHNWWWMPLMFAYPFYNEKRASENILLMNGRDMAIELGNTAATK